MLPCSLAATSPPTRLPPDIVFAIEQRLSAGCRVCYPHHCSCSPIPNCCFAPGIPLPITKMPCYFSSTRTASAASRLLSKIFRAPPRSGALTHPISPQTTMPIPRRADPPVAQLQHSSPSKGVPQWGILTTHRQPPHYPQNSHKLNQKIPLRVIDLERMFYYIGCALGLGRKET
jgi:hypothetical protein